MKTQIVQTKIKITVVILSRQTLALHVKYYLLREWYSINV